MSPGRRKSDPSSDPGPRRRSATLADALPVAIVVLGFVLIAVGWNGAASLDYTEGQIPYLISGGLAGTAAVFYGAASMIVRALKKGQARQQADLAELSASIVRLAAVLSWSTNGHAKRETIAEEADLVVAGPSSFHRDGCRIVKGRQDLLVRIPRPAAREQGLAPCRVCNP